MGKAPLKAGVSRDGRYGAASKCRRKRALLVTRAMDRLRCRKIHVLTARKNARSQYGLLRGVKLGSAGSRDQRVRRRLRL